MKTYSRLFFALWPDEQTRQALTHLSHVVGSSGKQVSPHNFHVTLAFLGNVDQATTVLIKQGASDIIEEPFELIFTGVSYWQQPKILCLTCNTLPQQAVDLAIKLDAMATQCGLQLDKRPWVPHITLIRHAQFIPHQPIEPISWRADAFCLVESCSEPEGVCYRVLESWPLSKCSL